MAKDSDREIREFRPVLDPSAPWASNGVHQPEAADAERAVVYCVNVEGLDLIKIGRTTQLKKRLVSLSNEVGRPLHIAHWSEFTSEDSKLVERCALLRMRRQFPAEGEWSLASPAEGWRAVTMASEFLGLRPAFVAGDPCAHDAEDDLSDVRRHDEFVPKVRKGGVDRDAWANP